MVGWNGTISLRSYDMGPRGNVDVAVSNLYYIWG